MVNALCPTYGKTTITMVILIAIQTTLPLYRKSCQQIQLSIAMNAPRVCLVIAMEIASTALLDNSSLMTLRQVRLLQFSVIFVAKALSQISCSTRKNG